MKFYSFCQSSENDGNMIVESQWIVDPMIILYSIQGRGRGDVHFVLGTTKVDKKVNILMLSNRKK